MASSKQEVFARAARGELKAPQLIPGFHGNDDGLENRTPIDNSVIGTPHNCDSRFRYLRAWGGS